MLLRASSRSGRTYIFMHFRFPSLLLLLPSSSHSGALIRRRPCTSVLSYFFRLFDAFFNFHLADSPYARRYDGLQAVGLGVKSCIALIRSSQTPLSYHVYFFILPWPSGFFNVDRKSACSCRISLILPRKKATPCHFRRIHYYGSLTTPEYDHMGLIIGGYWNPATLSGFLLHLVIDRHTMYYLIACGDSFCWRKAHLYWYPYLPTNASKSYHFKGWVDRWRQCYGIQYGENSSF